MRALWRYRYVILAVALLAAAVGYVEESRKPPVYEAVTIIKYGNPYDRTIFRNELGVPFTDTDHYLNSEADLVRSPQVMAGASRLLGGGARFRPAAIRLSVSAESSTKLFEVTVRARRSDPVEAATVLNAVTKAYQEVAEARVRARVAKAVSQLEQLKATLQARLEDLSGQGTSPARESERNGLSGELADLETRAGQIRADAAIYGAGIDRIDEAAPPEVAVSDSPRRRAMIFGLLGFIAALVAAFWRGERVRMIESADDAGGAVGAPVLGVLPRHPTDSAPAAAPVISAPGSAPARDYEFIASTLALAARESGTRLVLVTSPDPNRAKSITTLNLGLSAAQDQRPVVLLDADESAAITSLLHAKGQRGLSDLAALSAAGFDCGLSEGSVTPVDRLDTFRLVPTGTRETSGRGPAESPQMAKILAQLQQEADLIVVDGPPLRESPGGMKLAAAVDGVVLVLQRGTPLAALQQAQAMLATAKAPIVGVVFDPSRAPRRWPLRGRRQGKSSGRRRRSS
jgi:Mrp family chromosome partitioning ATPase